MLTGTMAVVSSFLHRLRRTRTPARGRFTFRLVPEEQVTAVEPGGALWRPIGTAPAFRLVPPDGRFPRSWALLDLELAMEGEPCEPVMQIDEGRGFEHGGTVCLPRSGDGRMREVILLPAAVHGLRLDLRGCSQEFRLDKASMREIGKAEIGLRTILPLVKTVVRQPRRLPGLVRRATEMVRSGGLQELKNRLTGTDRQTEEYARWIARYDTLDTDDVAQIQERIAQLTRRPRISVIMPVYNAPERWLRRAIESVQEQLYPDWELCIADDASTDPHVRRVLEECAARDPRITVVFRERNGHIAEASNSALAVATGEFMALLDHDDELPRHALYLVAEEIKAHPDVDLIYSDEDKIDESGRRYEAYFKPDWDPDLFGSQNLFSHLGVYRIALVRKIGGFRSGLDGSQDYDLALRSMHETRPEPFRHIPYVLYHWRADRDVDGQRRPVQALCIQWRRGRRLRSTVPRGRGAGSSFGRFLALYRVRYPVPDPPPLVSVVVTVHGGSPAFRRRS